MPKAEYGEAGRDEMGEKIWATRISLRSIFIPYSLPGDNKEQFILNGAIVPSLTQKSKFDVSELLFDNTEIKEHNGFLGADSTLFLLSVISDKVS